MQDAGSEIARHYNDIYMRFLEHLAERGAVGTAHLAVAGLRGLGHVALWAAVNVAGYLGAKIDAAKGLPAPEGVVGADFSEENGKSFATVKFTSADERDAFVTYARDQGVDIGIVDVSKEGPFQVVFEITDETFEQLVSMASELTGLDADQIIVGDAPELSVEHEDAAEDQLREADDVLGGSVEPTNLDTKIGREIKYALELEKQRNSEAPELGLELADRPEPVR